MRTQDPSHLRAESVVWRKDVNMKLMCQCGKSAQWKQTGAATEDKMGTFR